MTKSLLSTMPAPAAICLAAFLGAALQAPSQVALSRGHTDFGIGYEDGNWHLHIGRHQDLPPAEYAPDEVVLLVGPAAGTLIPPGQAFGFLGEPGAPAYILPQVENPALLFLGLDTEELPAGMFTNNQVRLTLKSIAGPGHFALYEVSALGFPAVLLNSRDGVSPADGVVLATGEHRHVNWAFSAPGIYELVFDASGTLAATGQFTTSQPATCTLKVLGEAPKLHLSSGPTGLLLKWPSVLGVNYIVQHREDMTRGDWINHGDPLHGTGSELSITPANAQQSGFFRLLLE